MFLLDTNVISEFAADAPYPSVVAWLRAHQNDDLFLSVITIGEIQQGIDRLPASKKRDQLTTWLTETLLVVYAGLILPVDTATMIHWGQLTAGLIGQGRKMLRRSLAGLVDAAGFAEAGVRPAARAEDLDLDAWARLARLPGARAGASGVAG